MLLRNNRILLLILLIFFVFNAANAENNINSYVDRSAPDLTVANHKLEDNKLTITGTSYDKYSGVESVSVSIDGQPFVSADSFVQGAGGKNIVAQAAYFDPVETDIF